MERLIRLLLPVGLLGTLVLAGSASADHPADLKSPNIEHVGNSPRTNTQSQSDLAFWKDLAFAGNYNSFRIIDISDPEDPRQISEFHCRAQQNDLTVYQARNRLLLIQSIDVPVTTAACPTAADNPIVPGTNPVTGLPGFFFLKGVEGLRIFDVTDPSAPEHIATVRTECGSHTHTLIPDDRNQRAIVYISSYPSGAQVTRREDLALPGPNCTPDHNKISIVEIPDANPEGARVLKTQPLDEDTKEWSGQFGQGGTPVRGCHDITVYEFSKSKKVAAAACLEEGQLWDVSDPANPTTNVPGKHTHIRNPFVNGPTPPWRGLFHSAAFSWDGEVVLFGDEWQGGGAHGCDGPEDTRGNIWFYDNAPPGTPTPALYGRYIIPRPQPPNEICTMHNFNVIPVNHRYLGVSAANFGGTSVFDFTGVESGEPVPQPLTGAEAIPTVAEEIAFFDPQGVDGNLNGSPWSSYWYNDYIYANDRRRGVDVLKLLDERGKHFKARKWHHSNPQTQETFQRVGR